MITRAHHVAIGVSDMEKALWFYRDLMGMELVMDINTGGPLMDVIQGLDGSNARIVILRLGDHQVELFQYRTPEGKPLPADLRMCDRGLVHHAFEVDDIEELYQDWKAKGIRFYSEPQRLGSAKVVYLFDPEGVTVELIQPAG